MFQSPATLPQEPSSRYTLLRAQLTALMEGVTAPLSNMANMAALLYQSLPELNWAGFYLCKGETLLLGPFQGKPACVAIPFGKGVCGTAAASRQAQLVPDVHAFPGHIACDGASASELVIPLMQDGQVLGVLDLDSPVPARFTLQDQQALTGLCALLMEACTWKEGLL